MSAGAVWFLAAWVLAVGADPARGAPDSSTKAAQAGEASREAEEESERSGNRLDFNFASSSGNAAARSLGLGLAASREAGPFRFRLDGGLLRASTGNVVRSAVGSVEDHEVLRTVTSKVSADRTYLRAVMTEAGPNAQAPNGPGMHFFGAAGWERDAAAGFRSRTDLTAGVQARFGEEVGLRAPVQVGAGLSLVRQEDEVPDPELGATTLGLRLDGRTGRELGDAELEVVAASTWNLGARDDLRLDVTGSVAMPLTERLAFRSSVQVLLDTRPALERLPLRAVPDGPLIGAVVRPRARADLILLAALAWRF